MVAECENAGTNWLGMRGECGKWDIEETKLVIVAVNTKEGRAPEAWPRVMLKIWDDVKNLVREMTDSYVMNEVMMTNINKFRTSAFFLLAEFVTRNSEQQIKFRIKIN